MLCDLPQHPTAHPTLAVAALFACGRHWTCNVWALMRMLAFGAVLSALLISLTPAAGASCEPTGPGKRDIFGVSTGMTISDAFSVLAKLGWTCERIEGRHGSVTPQCSSNEMGLTFRTVAATADPNNHIVQITYRFRQQNVEQLEQEMKNTYCLSMTATGYAMRSGEHMYINAGRVSILDQRLEGAERQLLNSGPKPKF